MEHEPIFYKETELYLVGGRCCLTNNCYGLSQEQIFGKPTSMAKADANEIALLNSIQ